ncbi:MAG TPA: hypothetical protein ENN07_01515 [candidate division Zixibacteria bacterium]|nr:hypothetical protein [candidate division Zixibacteria bacterium]
MKMTEKKFFGAPDERKGRSDGTTDYEKGKSYYPHLMKTYEEYGFEPDEINRIWVYWILPKEDSSNIDRIEYDNKKVEIISFRDSIIPELESLIGSSNYNDNILRTISFLNERDNQLKI